MNQRFADRTVLVTGASSGVGEAAARMFAAEGARVVLVARTAATLEKVAKDIGDRALAIPTDISDGEQVAALVDQVLHDLGDLHVLVNNAGFNHRGRVLDADPASLAHIVDVNLKAPILLTHAFLAHLAQHEKANIVNVASIAGQIPLPGEATYSATKFGLRGFSMALADEMHDTSVAVSIVSPGPIDTGFLTDDVDSVPDLVFSQPMSTAEEVAAAVLDCAHDGRRERTLPRLSGALATAGYLLPDLPRLLRPLLEKQGRAAKAKYRKERAAN
jgi:short-subunit dehydrogenase